MATKKEAFIDEVERAINKTGNNVEDWFSEEALDFWNGLTLAGGGSEKPLFTPNGKLILKYMQDNKESYNNIFKAKDIGEGLGISSRTASGGLRKLVTDAYVEKVGADPIVYALTEKGTTTNPDEE